MTSAFLQQLKKPVNSNICSLFGFCDLYKYHTVSYHVYYIIFVHSSVYIVNKVLLMHLTGSDFWINNCPRLSLKLFCLILHFLLVTKNIFSNRCHIVFYFELLNGWFWEITRQRIPKHKKIRHVYFPQEIHLIICQVVEVWLSVRRACRIGGWWVLFSLDLQKNELL